jgi:predicted nucleotidyltransferase
MALDIETVISGVKNYVSACKQVLSIEKAMLFGSYAKGTANDYSDVDVCFFIDKYTPDEWLQSMFILYDISHKKEFLKLRLEPILFEISDLYEDNPFVREVLNTGIDMM